MPVFRDRFLLIDLMSLKKRRDYAIMLIIKVLMGHIDCTNILSRL